MRQEDGTKAIVAKMNVEFRRIEVLPAAPISSNEGSKIE